MIKRTSLEHINSILKQNTNWNILDIGCGYTAHPKATIICDVQNLADYYPDQKFIQLTEKKLPESIYWDTVQGFVELSNRISELSDYVHRIWSTPSGTAGLIGASAAIAWQGQNDFTWECTAWRQDSGPRNVPESLVLEMSNLFPSTILNRDPNAGRSLIAPRTPCPVLYGIRGESRHGVLKAHAFLQERGAEKSSGHRAHRTNQATDDHLISVESGVVNNTRIMQGGHVEINVGDTLLSFSQGGDVNILAQRLIPGDLIEWYGLHDFDGGIHLERLRLIEGERNKQRPNCRCGSRYKSQGTNQLLRCPSCGSEHQNMWLNEIVSTDWKEPPPSYRPCSKVSSANQPENQPKSEKKEVKDKKVEEYSEWKVKADLARRAAKDGEGGAKHGTKGCAK